MSNASLLWLFMVFFMLHEFEEMIYLNAFVKSNRKEIARRIPARFHPLLRTVTSKSNEQFVFSVLEESMLLAGMIILCEGLSLYSLFSAVAIVYMLHVVVHIVQAIYLKRYVPAVASGLISSAYSLVCIFCLGKRGLLLWKDIVISVPLVAVLVATNLIFVNYLSKRWVK